MGGGTVFIVSLDFTAIRAQAKYIQFSLLFFFFNIPRCLLGAICSEDAFMNRVKVQSAVALDLVWAC